MKRKIVGILILCLVPKYEEEKEENKEKIE